MTHSILPLLIVFLLWGTVVGLDLVSVPQILLSRPLVAGTGAGLLAALVLPDHPAEAVRTGLVIGAILELYALDVLPVGAVRYPDYGPATVAAVFAALDWPLRAGAGVAVGVGLMTAVLGGWAMQAVRRANARAIDRRTAALAAGDTEAIAALQLGGLRRDLARSLAVTTAGLLLANVIWPILPPGTEHFRWITTVAVAGGIASAIGGAVRTAGRGRRLAWLLTGLATGTLVAGFR